jgi:hypothetical protein
MMNLERMAPMNVSAVPLADGDAGIAQTVRAMRQLIEAGKKDPVIRELAASILTSGRVPAFNWDGEVRAVFDWVLRSIRFTRDVQGKETLHAAREIVRLRIGDCDDFTILMCSLLGTIGYKTRIVTISNHDDAPDQFTHVYPEVFVNGMWIPVDAARRQPQFAQAPQTVFRKRLWSTSSDEYRDVQGLNGVGLGRGGRPGRRMAGLGAGRRPVRALGASIAPNALPGAYRFDTASQLSRLRAKPPIGVGRYGRMALGDDSGGFDWSQISDIINSAGTATASIIKANNTPQFPFAGTINPATGLPYSAINPATGLPYTSPVNFPLSLGNISPTTLLLGALVIGAIALGRH